MGLGDIRTIVHVASDECRQHQHAEGQLLTIEAGIVSIEADAGRWVMPTGCLAWVPPQYPHGACVLATLQATSLYFDSAWSRTRMPGEVRLVRRTPLIDALLGALIRGIPVSAMREHYLEVFAHAFMHEGRQELFLPMPRDARLLKLATQLLAVPEDSTGLDGWASRVGMARRTLTRRFQAETGWSLAQWRQQLRLMKAMEQLAAGHAVTTVSLSLGYASASRFIAVFRRFTGKTPGVWQSEISRQHRTDPLRSQ